MDPSIVFNWDMFGVAVGAAVSALGYSLAVYFSKTKEEDWRPWKAAQTAILAGGVAFVAVLSGMPSDVIMSSPLYAFCGIVLERGLKIVQKRYWPNMPLIIK